MINRVTLTITYHMDRKNETAESCVDVPVYEDLADNLLVNGCTNPLDLKSCDPADEIAVYVIWTIVSCLAYLQNYESSYVVDIRKAEVRT